MIFSRVCILEADIYNIGQSLGLLDLKNMWEKFFFCFFFTYAVTGIYFYDAKVFSVIRDLKPSKRGELEITDVNNHYIQQKQMKSALLDGWWTDAGTPDSYRLANQLTMK